MKKFKKIIGSAFIPVTLILIISLSRIIPHPYNFTPVLAVGIFSGFYFKQFFLSFFIILFSMFIGDLYFGFHNTMLFTYFALAIPVIIGIFIKKFKFHEILIASLVSSVCFFLITNFGVWIVLDIYEKSLEGLMNSYTLALPFFHNTLISTFLYTLVFKFLFDFFINKKKYKVFLNNRKFSE